MASAGRSGALTPAGEPRLLLGQALGGEASSPSVLPHRHCECRGRLCRSGRKGSGSRPAPSTLPLALDEQPDSAIGLLSRPSVGEAGRPRGRGAGRCWSQLHGINSGGARRGILFPIRRRHSSLGPVRRPHIRDGRAQRSRPSTLPLARCNRTRRCPTMSTRGWVRNLPRPRAARRRRSRFLRVAVPSACTSGGGGA